MGSDLVFSFPSTSYVLINFYLLFYLLHFLSFPFLSIFHHFSFHLSFPFFFLPLFLFSFLIFFFYYHSFSLFPSLYLFWHDPTSEKKISWRQWWMTVSRSSRFHLFSSTSSYLFPIPSFLSSTAFSPSSCSVLFIFPCFLFYLSSLSVYLYHPAFSPSLLFVSYFCFFPLLSFFLRDLVWKLESSNWNWCFWYSSSSSSSISIWCLELASNPKTLIFQPTLTTIDISFEIEPISRFEFKFRATILLLSESEKFQSRANFATSWKISAKKSRRFSLRSFIYFTVEKKKRWNEFRGALSLGSAYYSERGELRPRRRISRWRRTKRCAAVRSARGERIINDVLEKLARKSFIV